MYFIFPKNQYGWNIGKHLFKLRSVYDIVYLFTKETINKTWNLEDNYCKTNRFLNFMIFTIGYLTNCLDVTFIKANAAILYLITDVIW